MQRNRHGTERYLPRQGAAEIPVLRLCHCFGVLLHYHGREAGLELRDHVEALHGGEKWNPR